MDRALELGINFFDTANVYGRSKYCGLTEEIMGRWFKQGNGRREQVVLASKVYGQMMEVPPPNEERGISAYKVRKHLGDSLRRLQTDHLDLYQVHHFDRRVTLDEFWTTFERFVNNGDVIYMGTSNFPGWGLAKFQMEALRRGRLGFVSEQAQYNLLNRHPELEVIPAARDFGIGILAYSPLAGGLLTGQTQTTEGTRTYSMQREYGVDLGSDQLTRYSALCRDMGENEPTVALAWLLANPSVSSVIIGPRTVEHLNGVMRAVEITLEADQTTALNDIFNINRGRALQPGESPEAFAW
jgi:aryl-alcohol dehydrogenase-like predicted oxidoreductase